MEVEQIWESYVGELIKKICVCVRARACKIPEPMKVNNEWLQNMCLIIDKDINHKKTWDTSQL